MAMRMGRLTYFFVCAVLLVSSCSTLKSNGLKSAVAPSSVAPSKVGAACPGVPTESVSLVAKNLSFRPSMSLQRNSDIVTNVECYGHNDKHLMVFYSHYGKNLKGKDVHELSSAYQASQPSDTFPVAGVAGAKGEVFLGDDGGGSSIITCGNSFILVSFYPWQELGGDLDVNLRNLALSMVPWVCQGEPVPGLGSELTPAFSDGTATASTSPDASEGAPFPTASESESGQ